MEVVELQHWLYILASGDRPERKKSAMRSGVQIRQRNFMVRLLVLSAVISLCVSPKEQAACASNDPLMAKRQEALLGKRADLERQLQNLELRLRQIELDRKDKLEELEQLYRAHFDLSQKHSFSRDIENEIASQSTNLRRIEVQRSDCLEDLDALYRGFAQINHDVADCYKVLH